VRKLSVFVTQESWRAPVSRLKLSVLFGAREFSMFKEFMIGMGALAVAGSAMAQTAATPEALCPGGEIVTVRFNELTPGGTYEGFKSAAAANQKFYRDRGINGNVQLVGRVMLRDPATGTWSFSPKDVSTAHVNPPMGRGDPNDPAWKAFVAQYDANSKVSAQRSVCYAPPIDETATITAEIKKFEQVWADRVAAGDATGLGALLDDGYISYGKAKPESKADILASAADPKKRPTSVKISDLTVKVDGSFAFAQGVWSEVGKDGKTTNLFFLDIWKQGRDGTWKALMSQVSDVPK
jgi:ketosteroid isomerase-like protein